MTRVQLAEYVNVDKVTPSDSVHCFKIGERGKGYKKSMYEESNEGIEKRV
jgi:hypothetical protein